MQLKDFILVCGHYGCGKTNFSVNLALDMKKEGKEVTVVDMDLVNPYFRTSDYRGILEDKGIHVITPTFGATNLDIPSLPAEMYSIFENKGTVIIDVGGDDVGATVLGRFYPKIKDMDYDLLYVVNCCRNMTATPMEAAEVLKEIEAVSRLHATKLVNNSHLMQETTIDIIAKGIEYTEKVSRILELPILCTVVGKDFKAAADDLINHSEREMNQDNALVNAEPASEIYPVDIIVRTVWTK